MKRNYSDIYILAAVWALISFYIFTFCLISYLKFTYFGYGDFDLAVHAQTIYNIIHGSIYSSILGIGFLGNHFNPILFLIAPLAIFNTPLVLLYLQSIMLGLGGWAIYLISKDALSKAGGLIFVFIYFFYPALGYLNLFEFHPVALATCFLFFMFYFFQKQNYKWFFIFMFLSLLCQENIALILIAFGIYAALLKRKPKWCAVPSVLGILWFYLTVFVLMPYFNQGKIQFFSIYSHLGSNFAQILKATVFSPGKIISIIFVKHKLIFLAELFGPVGFMSIFSPLELINFIPMALQHLLSCRIPETTIYYHYQAEMIPFIFISAIYGVRNILRLTGDRRIYKILLMPTLIFIVLYYNFYLGPHFKIPEIIKYYKKGLLSIEKDRLLKIIPPDASVVATFEFLPKLSFRKNLYSFHHVYAGHYTLSTLKYELPQDVGYAIIDTDDYLTFQGFYDKYNYKNFINFISNHPWQVLDFTNSIMLLKKYKEPNFNLYKVIDFITKMQHRLNNARYDGLRLIGYDLSPVKGDKLEVTFYWQCTGRIYNDIYYYIDVVNERSQPVFRYVSAINYGIYPTHAWKVSEFIQEKKRILLPSLPKGKYSLELGFLDCTKTFGLTIFTDVFGRSSIRLGEIVK